MRYIYQYPELSGSEADMLDSGPVTEQAVRAEQSGWHGFAFTEHPVPGARWLESGGHQALDPLAALAFVAASTSQLRLLTYLIVAPYRNPFLLAKAAATVDKLSGGRLILGMGTGYQKSEFFALGVDFAERNALFDEALDTLPLHWSGAPFSYEGRHFNARDVIALPRPVQRPIPIWIGGNSTLTLRRVAERAQGWMPLVGSPQLSATTRTVGLHSVADVERRLGDLRELAGERADQLDVAVGYHVDTVDSPADIERHRKALGELERIGMTWVIVSGRAGSAEASQALIERMPEAFV